MRKDKYKLLLGIMIIGAMLGFSGCDNNNNNSDNNGITEISTTVKKIGSFILLDANRRLKIKSKCGIINYIIKET